MTPLCHNNILYGKQDVNETTETANTSEAVKVTEVIVRISKRERAIERKDESAIEKKERWYCLWL